MVAKVEFYAMPKELEWKDIIKTKFSIADIGWLLVNLLPLAFYLAGTLSAIQAFLLYLAETIIIGMYNTARLAVTTFIKRKDLWDVDNKTSAVTGWMFVFFFIVHFGFFVFVQFTIFMNAGNLTNGFSPVPNIRKAWDILGTQGQLFVYINMAILFMQGGMTYVREREYETKSMMQMMFEPYLRIFVQQFTVIAGAMLISFNLHSVFLIIFMMAKIFFTCFIDERAIFSRMKNAKQS